MLALIGISNLVVIYFGGLMYINGTIKSIGTIAEFILYVNMLTWPVASLGWVSSMVQEAEASQKRINEFLKIVPEIQNKNPEKSIINGAISFENVSYTYEVPQLGQSVRKHIPMSSFSYVVCTHTYRHLTPRFCLFYLLF